MARVKDTRLAGAEEVLLNDPGFLREVVERVLQEVLEAEMKDHLQAGSYERSSDRRGYRNGYKPRTFKTRVGRMNFRVPQDRDGTFKTELFERYQRSERAVQLGLMEMYLQGVSTRRVREVTETLCGTSFSKSTVSRLATSLDGELQAWRDRPLDAMPTPYLVIDARYEHVRVHGQVVSRGVLIVKGIREDGKREILAVDVADTESEASYDALFVRLKERGLHGVAYVVSDEHRGLVNAIAKHFQGVVWQRCMVHYLRNARGKVTARHQDAVTNDLKAVYAAPDKVWAMALARDVVERWRGSHPRLAAWIEETIESTLAFHVLPVAHQRRMRSTNGLERFNKEVKRRTRVMGIFPNDASCLRTVTAMCTPQSEEWTSGRVYLDMTLRASLEAREGPGGAEEPGGLLEGVSRPSGGREQAA